VKRSRCVMVTILALLGCGGAPSEAIEALPPSEAATVSVSAGKGSRAGATFPDAVPASPSPAERDAAEAPPGSALQSEVSDFDGCRRMRVQPAWCRKSPADRIRVSDTARGEGR
jgi:hypothetical protein